MDTPLADAVQKENVHVGGGKTTTMRKPIKLKPAGKKSKTLTEFKDTHAPSSRVSNDVDLKSMAHEKQQIAGADLFNTKNQIKKSGKTTTMRKPIKSKPGGKKSKSLAEFKDTYAPSSRISNDVDLKPMAHGKQHVSSNEKTKEYYDWAKEEGWGCSCSLEDELKFYRQRFIWKFALEPNLSDNKGYAFDDQDFLSLLSISDEEREAEC